jgi:hypothetical protein
VTNPESNISRWVTFLLGPLILLASAFVAAKAKQWFNYDLNPAEAAAYFFGIVGSVGALIYKWLHNRGIYEVSKTTGLDETLVNHIVSTVEERLPQAPSAPTAPAEGAPAAAHAPPVAAAAAPPVPPTPAATPVDAPIPVRDTPQA